MSGTRTFAMIKPDAMKKKIAGKMLARVEHEGFVLLEIRLLRLTYAQVSEFYQEHAGRFFFNDLCGFMTSGPVVAMALERNNAVAHWRAVLGLTDSRKAAEADRDAGLAYARSLDFGVAIPPEPTLRGRYGNMTGTAIWENVGHGSDGDDAAEREIGLVFGDGWSRA